MARAEALAAEARKNPSGFAELARKNSADGSARGAVRRLMGLTASGMHDGLPRG